MYTARIHFADANTRTASQPFETIYSDCMHGGVCFSMWVLAYYIECNQILEIYDLCIWFTGVEQNAHAHTHTRTQWWYCVQYALAVIYGFCEMPFIFLPAPRGHRQMFDVWTGNPVRPPSTQPIMCNRPTLTSATRERTERTPDRHRTTHCAPCIFAYIYSARSIMCPISVHTIRAHVSQALQQDVAVAHLQCVEPYNNNNNKFVRNRFAILLHTRPAAMCSAT